MAHPTPPYEWTCQRCHGDNAAHTDACATCGMSANFTAAQLAEFAPPEERPVGPGVVEGIGIAVLAAASGLIQVFFPSEVAFWLDPRLLAVVVLGVALLIGLFLKKAFNAVAGGTRRR